MNIFALAYEIHDYHNAWSLSLTSSYLSVMFMKLLIGLSFQSPKLNERTVLLVEKSVFVWQLNVKFELKVCFWSSIASITGYGNLWDLQEDHSQLFLFYFCSSIISDGFNLLYFLCTWEIQEEHFILFIVLTFFEDIPDSLQIELFPLL